MLHVGHRNIYRLARERKIPHIRIGRYVIFRKKAIKEWLASKERRAESP